MKVSKQLDLLFNLFLRRHHHGYQEKIHEKEKEVNNKNGRDVSFLPFY